MNPISVLKKTLVEGDPKVPFSIATTPRCRGALLHSLDYSTLSLILTFKCWVLSKAESSTIFESLIWLDLGLNPGLPDHWTLYPLYQCKWPISDWYAVKQINQTSYFQIDSLVGRSSRIHRLHLCREVRLPKWEFLVNTEYPFIAIAPRSTLARISRSW